MKKIADLNRLYTEGESADSELFAEQRSNVRLVSGDHYTSKNSRFWGRIRDSKQISNEAKIRLTKNHIQKITKTYANNIGAHAPGVGISPQNENELQDQKAAELAHSVWQDLKNKEKLNKRVREWVKDFIDIGECFVKVFWDPRGGELVGYEAEVQRDERGEPVKDESGNVLPVMDEMGQMVPSKRPAFSGAIKFERFHAFNVIRHTSVKSMDESSVIILRKMVDIKDLKAMVGDDEEKLKFIQESSQDTFTVFDGTSGKYSQPKNQCMVREYYFRSCSEYPKGYYYITTEAGILFEGELPFGIFPIHYVGFDDAATSPRARSIIKVLRPYQAEVNRAGSKIAEHQVTLGDDKLLIQSGTKLTHGGTLSGVRGIQYSGAAPGVLAGRSGEQYLGYMTSQIDEMYKVSNVFEDAEETKAQMDPYTLLYRSIRNKKKFSLYGIKFEEFLISICETALDLARQYYTEDMMVAAVGRREYINISEFKNSNKLCYMIKLEPQGDDIETKLGKQLAMNSVIQYVGKDLGKDAIGRVLKAMPFVNDDEAFNDLTIDYENAVNDILALDRGQYPQTRNGETIPYLIKRLTHRTKQSDFNQLPQPVQQNYQKKLEELEKMQADIQAKLQAAQAGYIPTSGFLVAADFYVSDVNKPGVTRRARIPYDALVWLIKKLDSQGTSLAELENIDEGTLSEIGQMAGPGPLSNPGEGVQQAGMGRSFSNYGGAE
jgi:hypothetical protein